MTVNLVRRQILTAISALILLVLLSGCSIYRGYNKIYSGKDLRAFDQETYRPNESRAVVVFGVATEEMETAGQFFMGDVILAFMAYWRAYDPETETLLGERNTIHLWRRSEQGMFDWTGDFDSMKYFAMEAEPGTYILTKTYKSFGNPNAYATKLTTAYVDYDLDEHGKDVPAGIFVGDSIAPRINVGPGEVIYVGDITFGNGRKRTHIKAVGESHAQASAFLRRVYPSIDGELIYRPMTVPKQQS